MQTVTPLLPYAYDDGGRAAAGYRGNTGDCCCRAIAIAARLPYQQVYDLINAEAARERPGARRRKGRRSHARTGVFRDTAHRVCLSLGAVWVPCMEIGSGCTVHVAAGELPEEGRYVLRLSRHFTALTDGIIRDTYNPARGGTRCVYGYWRFPA